MNNGLLLQPVVARLMRSLNAPQLSAIVVAHDSGELLQRCLDSIEQELSREDIRAEIWVIDNASRDGCTDDLGDRPQVSLLRNARNLGFGAAVNQGFRKSSGDLVLLLNPDAELEPGALKPLLESLEKHPESAIAAPSLLLPSGRRQNSPRRFYSLSSVLARRTPFGATSRGRKALQQHLMLEMDRYSNQEVDWVSGAAMLLRRSAVPSCGPFDERYFLYFEDVDLCRRLAASNRSVRYEPRSRVRHGLSAASRRQVPWNRLLWHHLQSYWNYALSWSGTRWRTRWWTFPLLKCSGLVARSLVIAGSGWLLGVEGLVLLLLAVCGSFVVTPQRPGVGQRVAQPRLLDSGLRLFLLALLLLPIAGQVTGFRNMGVPIAALGCWAALSALALQIIGLLLQRPVVRRTLGLRSRALVMGPAAQATAFFDRVAEQNPQELSLLGYVPLDPLAKDGPQPRLRARSEVTHLAADLRADVVLVVGRPEDVERSAGQIAQLARLGVAVSYVMMGATELLQAPGGPTVAGFPALTLGAGPSSRGQHLLVRWLGRCAALVGLILLLPVAPVLLWLSWRLSARPPLYGCLRVGRDGKRFSMLRLRTGVGPVGDHGGGKLGQLMRKLHIDELPQLWNVVVGEMALVGPRPIKVSLAEQLEPWQAARLQFLPGITGVWQLDRLRRWRLEEMISADLLYVLRWSPRLDLEVLLATLLGRSSP
ncbi:MAG: hypothetical protein CMP23_14140 [Rickettsiales bacterium]|nr:hypothetical protein [Rickettsiales bacterium]